MKQKETKGENCPQRLKASRDALEVIRGKWRIPIIISLVYSDKRFGEIILDIGDISPKMLSQELKVLEENKIIIRKPHDDLPPEYSLTPLGRSMRKLLNELLSWGEYFRNEIIQKKDTSFAS